MKFDVALAARLDIIRPSCNDFKICGSEFTLTPGVKQFITSLLQQGKHVYFVSGGFRLMIEHIARDCGVDVENIYANTIVFNEDGSFKEFDATEPTSKDGGKEEALNTIIEKGSYKKVIMIGDGVTDMQAKPPAKAFIGFGGNQVRKAVKEGIFLYISNYYFFLSLVYNIVSNLAITFKKKKKRKFLSFISFLGADWFVTSFDDLIKVIS